MNIEKSKLKILVGLIFFVLVILISIILMYSIRENIIKDDIVNSAIEGTNWPINDVPLLVNDQIEVKDLGQYTCQANVASGVTYEELREYLIKLYDAGFEPNSYYGSKNPKHLTTSLEDVELKEVTWIASKDKYEITVIWAEDGALNEFGDEYAYNFDMNLFINPGTTNNTNSSEDINFSDISGEVINDEVVNDVSGENI